MAFLETIDKDLIKVPLTAKDGKGVIEELVRERIVFSVMERESLGSTAIENGIAIPHAKIEGLSKAAVMIGISRLPIDFGGDRPSSVFFLVLAPADNPAEHIQILSSIAKVCSSTLFVRMLSASRSKEDVYQLFFD